MALSTVDFVTTFQLGVSPKKFSFEDTTDYAGQGVNPANATGVLKVVDPTGTTVYNNTNHSDPDIDPDVSPFSVKTILVPLSGGVPIPGTYSFTYTVRVVDTTLATTYEVPKTVTFDYAYTPPEVELEMTVDCVIPLLRSNDVTNYVVDNVTPTISRVHKIIYPPSVQQPDVTGTTKVLDTNVFYTIKGSELLHTSSLTSTLTYDFGDVIITDEVEGGGAINVACDGELCDIYCCIRAQYNRWQDNKTRNSKEANNEWIKFAQMMEIAQLVETAVMCGKSSDVSAYVSQIQLIGNCESGCGCDDGTPVLVTGLGGSAITVDVVSGGNPVVVTKTVSGNTTTFTISLQGAFVTKVNNSYNSTVAAGTNISVVTTTDVNGNKTYTVSATGIPAQPNILAFLVDIDFPASPTSGTPVITITKTHKTGTAFTSSPAVDLVNTVLADWLAKTAAFEVSNIWASMGSLGFKPNLQVVQADTRASGGSTSAETKPQAYFLEIYQYTTTTFRFRFVDHIGNPATGRPVAVELDNVKLQITLTA